MRPPSRIANNPDHYRPRAANARAGRGLRSMIASQAAPRAITIGSQVLLGGDDGSFSSSPTGAVGNMGDPITGITWAICGYSTCGDSHPCGP